MNVVFYHSSANQCYFFMRTIFDYPAFNPPFPPIRSAFSPFFSVIPRSRSPQFAEHLYFSCWTALGFEELLSTTYLISYSFHYSSYFSPFLLGAHHAPFSCIREPQLRHRRPLSLCGLLPPHTQVSPTSRPPMTRIYPNSFATPVASAPPSLNCIVYYALAMMLSNVSFLPYLASRPSARTGGPMTAAPHTHLVARF